MAIFDFIFTLVGLGSIHIAAASTLSKRDAPLATVNIPLAINSDRKYVVGVDVSTSPVQQSFRFAVSANTGYNAVVGVACDGCDGVPTYNASASSTQQPFPGSVNITVGTASISGPFIKENCSLHEANGTGWQYPNQTIIVMNSSSSIFSDVTSGLIGLGTNANGLTGDFYDTIFGGWLVRNPSRNNFSFGMDLRPPVFTSDDDMNNGGVLHWVLPDSSAYQGNIAWLSASVSVNSANATTSIDNASTVTSNTVSGFALPETDWLVELEGWSASISGTAVANTSKAQALIEPFFPDIFFPASQANLLYAAIPSAVKITSLVSGAQTWTIPCDSDLSIAFTFGGQSFPIDKAQLVEQQTDGSCVGTIKGWPDDSVNNFLLGGSFIASLYLIFVIARPGSGDANAIGMALKATSSGSSTNVGAIVGGTVGGVVGVSILVATAYLLGRGWRRDAHVQHFNTNKSTSGAKANEQEKFIGSRNEEGSDENGGAQYAVVNALHNGPYKHSPTTPLSGHSTQPLLAAEAQTPRTPNTPSDFLAMSPSASHGSNVAEVGSHISYNPQALAANVSASRASAPYPPYPTPMIIEPFVMSSGPLASAGNRDARTNKSSPAVAAVQGHGLAIQDPFELRSSPQDIDPFSPSSSASTNAAAAQQHRPFILATVPGNATVRRDVPKGSRPPQTQRQAQPQLGPSDRRSNAESPAPPYTAEANPCYPVSPTLVEPSHNSESAVDDFAPQERREKP